MSEISKTAHKQIQMTEKLLAYCAKYIELSDLDGEQIVSTFKPIQLKRKDYLLTEGKVCDFIAFLNTGIIRHFHIKDGNEITCDITLPNNFITDCIFRTMLTHLTNQVLYPRQHTH